MAEFRDADIFGGGASSEAPRMRDTDIFGDLNPKAEVKMSRLPTMQDSLREEVAGRPGAAFMAGMGTVVDNAALRLKQLVSGLTPQDTANVQANRDLVSASPWALGGNIAGNAAAMGAIAGPSVLGNAAVGAGAGFMDPVMGNESAAGKSVMGGIFGAGGGMLGKLITGSPVVAPTPAVRELFNSGVVPTVGQAASSSPSKFAQALGRAEEKMQSIPAVGDMITAARQRGVQDFNRAAIQKAMPPGQTATTIGNEGVDIAKQALGSAYDDIYKNGTIAIDKQLLQGVAAAKNSTTLPMNAAGVRQFDDVMKRYLWDRLPQGQSIPSRTAKMEIEGDLGKAARELRMSSVAAERSVGEAIQNARNAFRDAMARNLSPDDAARLPAVDAAYARMQAVKKAAERGKGNTGVFTPFQLQSVTRPGDEMRGFANAGQSVLANRFPNSGTTDRAMLGALALGAAPAGAGYALDIPELALFGLAPAAYSRTGARHLLGDLTPQAVQNLSPMLSQAIRARWTEENR